MYQVPNYTEAVSMRLSEVLADIGVDERTVMKRRRTMLLIESICNINQKLRNVSTNYLGSQSEGTTTHGLSSDSDLLYCFKNLALIQDWSDWEPGKVNFLMIQDNTVSPGYCLLQRLRYDVPLPVNGESCQGYFRDRTGKLLLKNTFNSILFNGSIIHGPAIVQQGPPGYCDSDCVCALYCKTWPQQAKQWLDQQSEVYWPSSEIKQYCRTTGCFVVAVGCRGSVNEQLEWRISTSLAEKCLMFNMNITQIRCYVLMKIIKKTFIEPLFKDVISSYMCKTALFHCISNTHSIIWRENNLLSCLSLCLYFVYHNINHEHCPHFIIPGNNLMRGKIPHAAKPYILEIFSYIINSEGVALLGIKCDDLGSRLHLKFYNLSPFKMSGHISGNLIYNLAQVISSIVPITLVDISLDEAVQTLISSISNMFNFQYGRLDKTALILVLSWYCTTLGSILASINIYQTNTVSADAFKLISLGLNTDVASSKLKLASILYCIQEIHKAEQVLSEIERRYDQQIVEPVCCCYEFHTKRTGRQGYHAICDNHNEDAIQIATASCVRFLPLEIHCVPHELRYEMFRSTQEDRMLRTHWDKKWMDHAVVDSLPYLYFLQYKVYSHLGRHDDKQAAFFKLLKTIKFEPNLRHRETALNILGKCIEQEGRTRDALQLYLMSLNVRQRNNAAKIHICKLLSASINVRA